MRENYYEMTDEEIEAAWELAHANGITAGPVSSIDYAFDLVKQAYPFEFEEAVKLLTILAGVYSIPRGRQKPASKRAQGKMAETWEELSRKCFELIKLIELESSGIHDGDGLWHGGDPVGGMMNDLNELLERARGSRSQDTTE